MKVLCLISGLAIVAGSISAQVGNAPEIGGTVLEPGTNLPVVGAQANLYEFVENQDRFLVRKLFATTSTDGRGAFQFHPEHIGDFYLEITKDGYLGMNPAGPGAETAVSLSRDSPSRELSFVLMRPGQLTGRVIDEDGKPVAGLRVSAQTGPGLSPSLGPGETTDRDGFFTITKLAPDKYVVRIMRPTGDVEIMVPSFTKADLAIVDQDWETYLIPMPVSPGATASVGNITIRKTAYYRAHISVLTKECGSNENWMFSAITGEPSVRFSEIPCTKEFLIRNLKPGPYWFHLTTKTGEQALSYTEVNRENVEVVLTMAPPPIVNGRLIPAEGAMIAGLNRLAIAAVPQINGFVPGQASALDSEGRFTFTNLSVAPYQIQLASLPAAYYVKEIHYNGIEAAAGIITPVSDGRLEIIIDDQAAGLTGSVTDGDKAANLARIVLLDSSQRIAGQGVAIKDGKFAITGLAPGEYRVLAIPVTGNLKLPDDLIRFLNSAEKIKLERGESQNVSLKLTDTSR